MNWSPTASSCSPPPAPPRCSSATASTPPSCASRPRATGPNGEQTIVQLIHDGEVDLIVNTPYGTGGRLDGYDIRTAAVARSVPCLTTVQALAAAVQGIDALNHGDVGVRSLQEHAEHLTAARD